MLFAAPACGSDDFTGPQGLAVARARWADRGPTSYTITVYRGCECLLEMSGPIDITVRDGVVISRRYSHDQSEITTAGYVATFPAVEGFFEIIGDELQRGTKPFEASYDAALGYPTRIFVGSPYPDGAVAWTITMQRQ